LENSVTLPGRVRILRRIHCNHVRAAEKPILSAAFRPHENDHDGLSVFRADVVTPEDLVSAAGQAAHNYIVARLQVADLNQLGLTVITDDSQILGHCLIPEINIDTYLANKHRWRRVLMELANLAARDVVYGSVA
jgi:hypothetical protein